MRMGLTMNGHGRDETINGHAGAPRKAITKVGPFSRGGRAGCGCRQRTTTTSQRQHRIKEKTMTTTPLFAQSIAPEVGQARARAERLDGTVALVTGASSGIGAATAGALAAQGAAVALAARRKDR